MKLPPARWQELVRIWPRWRGWLCAIAVVSLGMAFVQAADDDEEASDLLPKESAELARKYAAVIGWKGFFEHAEAGTVSWTGLNSAGAESIVNAAHGHFTLARSHQWSGEEVRRGVLTWGGDNTTVCGEQTVTSDLQSSHWHNNGTGEEVRTQVSGTLPMTGTEFTIWLPTKKKKSYLVSVHPGGSLRGKTLTVNKTGRMVWDESKGNGTDVRRTRSLDEILQADSFVHWYSPDDKAGWFQIVRTGPGVLVFPFESTTRADTQISTPGITRRSRVFLCPVYDDLELQVTIEGYAKWRPEGSIKDPTKPGNSLVARATLKSKTGKVKDLPEVKRFKFELLDTSREPGVCLNWPLGAKDQDYDLRLADEGSGKLSDSDQKLSITDSSKDDKEQPYAEAKIDSYDFGGRATLQVVCELADGREIVGLMKGAGGQEDLVRLPKMDGPGWIAESWRKEHKAENLADNDDNEKVDGQNDNGDGFTLYEEYRGWAVNEKHVEGDPERKDFFVLNRIGLNARPGIELFEQLSKLRVHSKLRLFEMSVKDRLMNGNHRDGPHRVDQHGVWVKTFTREKLGDNGADTPMTKAGVAGRPGITKGIGILSRNNTESIFNQPFNLPAQDAIFAYDRAIAHELLHSVGVEHHGPDDKTGYALIFIPPNVPENKIGRPHYQTGNGTVFTILQENGHDLAAAVYVQYADVMGKCGAMMMDMLVALWSTKVSGSKDPAVARKLAEASMRGAFDQVYEQKGMVGHEHASHSGNEDCVMRYYFARFYEAKNKENTLYIVTPGTERIGLEICHAGKGTGNNAPKPPNLPQSRYGDAAAGEGNCFSQICPNDAIPPRTVK